MLRFFYTLVKNTPHANSTLSSVRRVTAFFAFLGFLTLPSCGEDTESSQSLMEDQTRVFTEMAALVNGVAEGGDQQEAAQKLTELQSELKDLKIRLANLGHTQEENRQQILDLSTFSEATAAYQKAQEKLFLSGRNTQELARAMTVHHNPAPMIGEGDSK